MSSYDAFFQNKSEVDDENYLQNLDQLFFDHPKHLEFNYLEKKDDLLDRTNYIEKAQAPDFPSRGSPNCIEVSKVALNHYIYSKKGQPNQTMELLTNFKTFLLRRIKDLLLVKVLNSQQTMNCLNFIKNKPSFKSLSSLLHPLQKCQQLRKSLLELLSSPSIVRQLMLSRIRLQQKQKLLKYLERMRDQIQNPGKMSKWKKLYL